MGIMAVVVGGREAPTKVLLGTALPITGIFSGFGEQLFGMQKAVADRMQWVEYICRSRISNGAIVDLITRIARATPIR